MLKNRKIIRIDLINTQTNKQTDEQNGHYFLRWRQIDITTDKYVRHVRTSCLFILQ